MRKALRKTLRNTMEATEEPQEVPPTRWEIELEFVQSLSNLNYLNYLAQNKYLEDPRFIAYLRYLYNYWSVPQNAKYIIYPNCLHIVKLLIKSKNFTNEILKREVAEVIINDMVENWKKTKLVETRAISDSSGSRSQASSTAIEENSKIDSTVDVKKQVDGG